MSYLKKIRMDYNNYTDTEKKIALYIINHLDAFKGCSSHSIALALCVAQSSISKFAKKLGAHGFADLKLMLIEEYSREKSAKADYSLHSTIHSSDPLNVIADKLIAEKVHALRETTVNMDFVKLEKIIGIIDKARHIQIVGLGGSALAAKDLAFKLLKIGYCVTCEIDTHVQISVAQALNKDDIQISLSYSGKKKEILIAAEAAKEKGAKIIAITSLANNPLRERADYILETVSNEDEWRSSSISSRTAQNCITDLLFVGLLQRNDRHSLNMIERSRELINRLE